MSNHTDARFTTFDQDLDLSEGNCAENHHGAWWYTACLTSSLNGAYLKGDVKTDASGVVWEPWQGFFYSLKGTEMKLGNPNFQQDVVQDEPVQEPTPPAAETKQAEARSVVR